MPGSYPWPVTAQPRWTTAVFDLDGTVVDTVPLIVASYQYAFRTHLGREEDEARIRAWIGQPLIRAFREVDPELAPAMYDTYLQWNHAHTQGMIGSFEGVRELLEDLPARGVRTGVATSKRRGQAQRAVTFTGLDDVLDLTVTLEDTQAHKPDPTPVLLACQKLGADPAQAVYVGDAAVDILAGRAAGLDTVAVTWGAATREALADAGPTEIVDSVEELRGLLLGG